MDENQNMLSTGTSTATQIEKYYHNARQVTNYWCQVLYLHVLAKYKCIPYETDMMLHKHRCRVNMLVHVLV